MYEAWRRLKVLMKATGLTQTRIAYITGVQQPEVAKWKDPANRSRALLRMERLAEYLADPTREVQGIESPMRSEPPPKAEPYSPILEGTEAASMLALAVFDERVSPEDWNKVLEEQIWAHSKAPFEASVLLSSRRTEKQNEALFNREQAKTEDLLEDLSVHGKEYVQRMSDAWHFFDETVEAHEEDLICSAENLGKDLLRLLGTRGELLGLQRFPEALHRKFEDGTLDVEDVKSEDIEGLLGESWIGSPVKFLSAMQFLSLVAKWTTDANGELLPDLVKEVWEIVRAFDAHDKVVLEGKLLMKACSSFTGLEWRQSIEAASNG